MQVVAKVLQLLKQSRHVEDEGIGRDSTPEETSVVQEASAEGSDDNDTTKIETQVCCPPFSGCNISPSCALLKRWGGGHLGILLLSKI